MTPNKLLQLLRDNGQPNAQGTRRIRAETAPTTGDVHLYVYDVIDAWWGASAADLIGNLAAIDSATVTHLHFNSPGGDVFEGRAMAAAIAAHAGKVITHIDGICASAATYPALAAAEVRMTDGGLFMVHNSWTLAMGDKTTLRTTADLLDKIDGTIAKTYADATGASIEQAVAWMNAETWFTAQDAMDAHFVDAIDQPAQAKTQDASAARWDLTAYDHAPKIEAPTVDDDKADRELAALQQQLNRNRLRLFTRI